MTVVRKFHASSIRALLLRAWIVLALLAVWAQGARAWEAQGHQLIVSSGTAILTDSIPGQYLELKRYLNDLKENRDSAHLFKQI